MQEARPCKKSTVKRSRTGNDTVLFDDTTGAVHVLNPTAELVWDLCDGSHGLADIEEALREKFSIGDDRDVAGDIREVLDTFAREGLLDT